MRSIIFFLMLSSTLCAQQKLVLEANATGADREMLAINNISNTNRTVTSATLAAASGTINEAKLSFSAFSKVYSGVAGYAGQGMLSCGDSGLILRAEAPNGTIRLLTGGGNLSNTGLTVGGNGNVGIGIGTIAQPRSQLQVQGDVYVSQVNTGIILTNGNNQCYRITVDGSGNLVTTAITCP